MKLIPRAILLAIPFLAGLSVWASDLPEPLSETQFEAVLNESPFLRTLDPSETFRLRGLATIAGKPVATLFNQKTEKSFTVTSAGSNEWGLKLVDVNPSDDLTGVSVRIAMSGEEFELKYEADRVTPGARNGGTKFPVKHDSKGRAIPPQELINKYRSMTDEQRNTYRRWREVYYKKHPGLEHHEKRFPIVDKAIDAIKKGKEPPKL